MFIACIDTTDEGPIFILNGDDVEVFSSEDSAQRAVNMWFEQWRDEYIHSCPHATIEVDRCGDKIYSFSIYFEDNEHPEKNYVHIKRLSI